MALDDAFRLAQKADEVSSRLNIDILAEMLNQEDGRQALLEIDPDHTQAIFDGRVSSPNEDHYLRIASDATKRIGKEEFDSIVQRHRDVVNSIVNRATPAGCVRPVAMWTRPTALHGDGDAGKILESITPRMSAEQITEAKALAQAWMASRVMRQFARRVSGKTGSTGSLGQP